MLNVISEQWTSENKAEFERDFAIAEHEVITYLFGNNDTIANPCVMDSGVFVSCCPDITFPQCQADAAEPPKYRLCNGEL